MFSWKILKNLNFYEITIFFKITFWHTPITWKLPYWKILKTKLKIWFTKWFFNVVKKILYKTTIHIIFLSKVKNFKTIIKFFYHAWRQIWYKMEQNSLNCTKIFLWELFFHQNWFWKIMAVPFYHGYVSTCIVSFNFMFPQLMVY